MHNNMCHDAYIRRTTMNASDFGRQVLGLVYNEKNKIRPDKIS